MADIALRDALASLKTKIQTITNSSGATAEDMAMLGVALEKIAGRVSATEIELIADEQKTALSGLTAAKSAEIVTKVAAAIQEIEDLLDTRETRFLGLANTAETQFNANAATRTTALTTASNAEISKVQAATGAAISTPTVADGSITYNRRGFATSWVSATGKTYTEITYDTRDRAVSWLETYTNGGGAIVRFRYAATYSGATANLKTLTRTAA